MKFNDLQITKNQSGKRLGRGIASGRGKTAGRGTKGQGARTGSSRKPGFEGGQNPLMQRLPKLPGFTSHRVKPETVTLAQIASLKAKLIDTKLLTSKGLITNAFVNVKLLGVGEIKTAVKVNLASASASAISALEAAGGSFEATPRLSRPANPSRRANRKTEAPKSVNKK